MKKWVLLLVLLGAAVSAALWEPWQHLPELVQWVQDKGLTGAIVLALIYAAATVLMVPGSLITLAVGFVYGPVYGLLLVSPASVLGATLAFLLGRTMLRESIEARMADSRRFQALSTAIEQQGFKILVLTRLSPVFPFTVLNYAFGLTRISLLQYVVGSFLAMLPGTFLYVYLGSTVQDVSELLQGAPEGGSAGTVFKWIGLAATVVVTVYVTRVARRALAEAAPSVLEDDAPSSHATDGSPPAPEEAK